MWDWGRGMGLERDWGSDGSKVDRCWVMGQVDTCFFHHGEEVLIAVFRLGKFCKANVLHGQSEMS